MKTGTQVTTKTIPRIVREHQPMHKYYGITNKKEKLVGKIIEIPSKSRTFEYKDNDIEQFQFDCRVQFENGCCNSFMFEDLNIE